MRIYPIDIADSRPWLPRDQVQMGMTAQEIEVDNYCREVLKILNKVTPQNIDSLLDRMATLNMNNEFNINKLVYYIVRKAEDEPLYSEVYAEMCCTLNQIIDRTICSVSRTQSSASSSSGNVHCGLFKTLMLKECQLAFDKIFDSEYHGITNDLILHSYRQKIFGIIILIGRLYNAEFLHEDILLAFMNRLLEEQSKKSLEFQIECLCKLLCISGLRIEGSKKIKGKMDHCFLKMDKIHQENEFCSRVKFAILDLIDLRRNKWVSRKLLETPTTIDEIRSTYVSAAVNTKKKKKTQKN